MRNGTKHPWKAKPIIMNTPEKKIPIYSFYSPHMFLMASSKPGNKHWDGGKADGVSVF